MKDLHLTLSFLRLGFLLAISVGSGWSQCTMTGGNWEWFWTGTPSNVQYNIPVSGTNCSWTATTASSWIIPNATSGTLPNGGNIAGSYSLAANNTGLPRQGMIVYQTGSSSVTVGIVQNPNSCAVTSLTPTVTMRAQGGNAPITIATSPANCYGWPQDSATPSWVGNGPTGNRIFNPLHPGTTYPTLPLPISRNTGPARSTTIAYSAAGASMSTTIQQNAPVFNDEISGAQLISSIPFSVVGNAYDATLNPSDPIHTCAGGSQNFDTVWFRYVANFTGYLHAKTINSEYDTVLAAYPGTTTIGSQLACNDDISGVIPDGPFSAVSSDISFPVQSGQSYLIQLSRFASFGSGDSSVYVLNVDACAYSLGPNPQAVGVTGGAGTVNITTDGSCPWSASTSSSWITFPGLSSGSGSGSLSFSVAVNNTGIPRSGTVLIGGQTLTINQAGPNCGSNSLNPTSASPTAAGGPGTVNVTSPTGCSWSATSNASWLSVTSGSPGSGNGSLGYSVQANTGPPRSGTLTIAGQTFTVNQGDGCSYSINPTNVSPGNGATTATVTVTAGTGCTWNATSNADWLSITSGSSGSGNGSVNYSVQANTGPPRSGTLTIAGQTFTVNQGTGCASFSINPTSASPGNGATTGTVNVTATAGCAWTASSNAAWLSITSGASGTGNGAVGYSVQANAGAARSGTLTIAGQTFTVNQADGCTYSINPTNAAPGSGTTTGTVNVTAGTGCAWTASSNAAWLSITSGASSTGTGPVGYSVQANSGAARSGTLTIAGQTFTVNQAAVNCSYSLSTPSIQLDRTAATGSVNVTAGPTCAWNTSAPDSWITITGGSSGTGNGTVIFTLTANSGPSRSFTLTIAGLPFLITQAGNTCQANLTQTSASVAAASGTGSIPLNLSGQECAWTAVSNAPWITVAAPGTGFGTANIGYSYSANPSTASRTGTISVAGFTYTLRQAGTDCSGILLSQSVDTVPAAGANRSVSVQAPVGCGYSASSATSFVSITSGVNGNGPGSVAYTVQPNTGLSSRRGTLTIAGQTYTINQAADTTPSISCSVTAANPPIVRSTGRTEQLADIDIECTGRTGGNAFSSDVFLTLTSNFTSRIVQASTESTDATLTVTGGGTFAGRVAGANLVRFANVPFSSGEPSISLRMRISKVRADASTVNPAVIKGTVSLRAPVPISLNAASQTLGTPQAPITSRRNAVVDGPSSSQKIVTAVVQEAFASAFDSGTRLRVKLSGLPSNAVVWAPVATVDNKAKLVSADDQGAGGSQVTGTPRAGGTYQSIPVSSGAAIATWEIVSTDPLSLETLQFPILVENASSTELEPVTMDAALAPFSTFSLASATAPVPRFADPTRRPVLANIRVTGALTSGPRVTINSTAALVYTIINDSDQPVDGVILRSILPDGLGSPDCSSPQGSCAVLGNVVRFDVGAISAGGKLDVGVRATAGGVSTCPNCTASASTVPNSNPNPTPPPQSGTGGLGTCANCLGNGSVAPISASVSANQEDPEPSNNTAEIPVEINASCTFTVSRGLLTAAPSGSTVRIDVTTGPTCEWELPPPSDAFVSVSPTGATVRGSATITVNITGNSTNNPRSTTISVAGTAIRIEQPAQACTPTLSLPGGAIPAVGGSFVLSITVAPACTWSVAAVPEWIQLSSAASGVGPASVSFNVQNNAAVLARNGFLEVSGQQVAISQPAAVAASGGVTCSYQLSTNAVNLASAATSGSVSVLADSGCSWTAVSTASWITVTSGAQGAGGGSVGYAVSANSGTSRSGSITIAGQTFTVNQAAPSPGGTPTGHRFVPVTPCRIMETRSEYNFEGRTGAFGPPYLRAGETRVLNVPTSNVCQIPATAQTYVLNVTLVPRGGVDFVTVWPGGEARPNFWTVRSPDGQIVANSAFVKAVSGAIQVYASNDTDVIIDISGYLTDAPQAQNLVFYSLTPCRVTDTRSDYRSPAGPFGPPSMTSRETRAYRFPATPYCNVPSGAAAYSVTLTVVPPAALQYLTAWPAGGSQPNVSNINSPNGRVLANSVIIPASGDGSINVFTFDRSDVLMDINGYFAPDDGVNGLYYYPVTQCRISDSRDTNGTYGGPIMGDESARTIPIPSSACAGVPASARAYAVNATAIPNGNPMPFLTVYPTGSPRPNASTLNAFQGQTVTNSVIVPAGTAGAVDIFAYRRTHVVLEISGYFGR